MNVYLTFNGNCEEAVNFYKTAIDAEIVSIQKFGDAPMPSAESEKNKVLHCIFTIAGTKVMCSDGGHDHEIIIGNNFSLALDFHSDETIQLAFDVLSGDGGKVTMPLQDTFWGAKFGMCVDKFGINWMFNFDKPKN